MVQKHSIVEDEIRMRQRGWQSECPKATKMVKLKDVTRCGGPSVRYVSPKGLRSQLDQFPNLPVRRPQGCVCARDEGFTRPLPACFHTSNGSVKPELYRDWSAWGASKAKVAYIKRREKVYQSYIRTPSQKAR